MSENRQLTIAGAREITREARQAFFEAAAENGQPIAIGVGDIEDFKDLVELRRAIEDAGLQALATKYEIIGGEGLTHRERFLLAEYASTEGVALHYNRVNMSIIAMANVITFGTWSIILHVLRRSTSDTGLLSIVFEFALFGMLSVLLQYATINRCIFTLKGYRLVEIEEDLGELDQHSRFGYVRKSQGLFSPGGQTTEILLYWVLSALGVGVALVMQWPIQSGASVTSYFGPLVAILPLFVMIWWGARSKTQVVRLIDGYTPRGGLHAAWMKLGGYESPGSSVPHEDRRLEH